MEVVVPELLRAGDRVALVSPASGCRADRLRAGVAMLEGWGLVVEHAPMTPVGYLAGSHDARRSQVQRAMDDPGIKAVLCTRGGVGTQRIVDGLDVGGFVRRRGVFVGFSDMTALHARLNQAGLVTFHGPTIAWNAERNGEIARTSLRGALFGGGEAEVRADPGDELVGLTRPGSTVGRLVGGNLSLMATSVGTPTQVDPVGGILFIEEARVRPRVIDRSLTQLRRSGCLLSARGIVLGQFHDCGEPTDDTRSLVDVLSDHLADFDGPVLAGIQAGHGHEQRTLPLGLEVELDGRGRAVRWKAPTR